jgi:hypothetical protein
LPLPFTLAKYAPLLTDGSKSGTFGNERQASSFEVVAVCTPLTVLFFELIVVILFRDTMVIIEHQAEVASV